MRHPRVLVFVATLTAALAAHANAPPDQYLTFPPNDPTIVDRQTGLTWQRTPNDAVPAISAANVCATVTLGGTWRLPTVKELMTIVDEAPHKEHDDGGVERDRYVDPNAFFATPAGKFIAASSDPTTKVWFVDFGTGEAGFEAPGTSYYVRCVR